MRRRRDTERERTNLLLSFGAFMVTFIYVDGLKRRDYVDQELTSLTRQTVEAKAKAEGATEASRARAESASRKWAGIGALAALGYLVLVLFTSHVI